MLESWAMSEEPGWLPTVMEEEFRASNDETAIGWLHRYPF